MQSLKQYYVNGDVPNVNINIFPCKEDFIQTFTVKMIRKLSHFYEKEIEE